MSIPKIIHYCWFGGGAISPENRKCMKSWKKYCPDYKIIEWNEQNFDIGTNRYAQQAYEAKKYAFVSDYARLAVVYEHGGIYLDTDVELVRPLDELLELPGDYEEGGCISKEDFKDNLSQEAQFAFQDGLTEVFYDKNPDLYETAFAIFEEAQMSGNQDVNVAVTFHETFNRLYAEFLDRLFEEKGSIWQR